MCKSFEARLENAKMAKEKVLAKRQVNETILIDDEMEVTTNLIKTTRTTDAAKKEVQLFANVTGKLQNAQQKVQQNEAICLSDDENDPKASLKVTKVDLNVQPTKPATTDELSAKERFEEELKKSFKTLKPENYRIQQVIREEDLVYFDLETGGMGYKEDILQIGALNHEGI